ncbi:hypothetical protein THIOKS1310032 [Thiocapsa sp. KS1]|nr:hypothetical protein THIOKS1310032 [Thiocapsa sp. KS1]
MLQGFSWIPQRARRISLDVMAPLDQILLFEKDDDFCFSLGRARRELKDKLPGAIDCRGLFHGVQH